MVPIYALVAFTSVALTGALVTTYSGIKNFHNTANNMSTFDTATLATATHVAADSNQLLSYLQNSIESSIDLLAYYDGENASLIREANFSLIDDRKQVIQDFLREYSPYSVRTGDLASTFETGLSAVDDSIVKKDTKPSLHLVNSDFLPISNSSNDRLASTLVENSSQDDLHMQEIQDITGMPFLNGIELNISTDLLDKMFGAGTGNFLLDNSEYAYMLGLIANPSKRNSLSLETLPNGIAVDIDISIDSDLANSQHNKQKENPSEFQIEKQIRKTAIAQFRLHAEDSQIPPPQIDDDCIPNVDPECTENTNVGDPEGPGGGTGGGEIVIDDDPENGVIIGFDPLDSDGAVTGSTDENGNQCIQNRSGGYTCLGVNEDENGYSIDLSVGNNRARTDGKDQGKRFDSDDQDLGNRVVLGADPQNGGEVEENYADANVGSRKRYGFVTDDTTIGGVAIQEGYMIVGTAEKGKGKRPGINGLGKLHIYDNDGNLVAVVNGNKLSKKQKRNMDFDYTDKKDSKAAKKAGNPNSIQDVTFGENLSQDEAIAMANGVGNMLDHQGMQAKVKALTKKNKHNKRLRDGFVAQKDFASLLVEVPDIDVNNPHSILNAQKAAAYNNAVSHLQAVNAAKDALASAVGKRNKQDARKILNTAQKEKKKANKALTKANKKSNKLANKPNMNGKKAAKLTNNTVSFSPPTTPTQTALAPPPPPPPPPPAQQVARRSGGRKGGGGRRRGRRG